MVAEQAEPVLAVLARIGVGLVDALRGGPVGASEGADAAGTHVLVQDVHELADGGDIGIVPMHHVEVRVVGLLTLERLEQLSGDGLGIAVRSVRALVITTTSSRMPRLATHCPSSSS